MLPEATHVCLYIHAHVDAQGSIKDVDVGVCVEVCVDVTFSSFSSNNNIGRRKVQQLKHIMKS